MYIYYVNFSVSKFLESLCEMYAPFEILTDNTKLSSKKVNILLPIL